MRSLVYTLTLNPALDYVIKAQKIKEGSVNKCDNANIYYGGKGINVSAVLTRLEISNCALGLIGGFTGRELERLVKEDNICSSFTYCENSETRINVKLKSDKETDINSAGNGVSKNDLNSLFDSISVLNDGDFLVMSGSIPKGCKSDIYEKIILKLNKKDILFVVDSTGDILLNTLKYKPFLIKPNNIELGEIFSVNINSFEDAVKYAKKLQNTGAQNVLVSLGGMGAVFVDENKNAYSINNALGQVKNTVGCGDSMLAGFIAGYLKYGSYETALKLASASGNACAFSDGIADKESIISLFENFDYTIINY